MAAWEYAKRQYGSDAKAQAFVSKLYKNVPVLDTGARGSSVSFAQRNQGDVFIFWENEAQDLAGKHYYRPRNEKFLAKYTAKLPKIQLFTLEKAFGSWEQVGKEHFADGGIFDQIDTPKAPSR